MTELRRWHTRPLRDRPQPLAENVADAPPITDPRWRGALQRIVRHGNLLTLHAQPIVELTTGAVAGYEMLSRFAGPWRATPDRWFAAADLWGVNALLQARVLRAGIAARRSLPPDTFLTVNVDPHLLADPEVAAVLVGAPDLTRFVLELTEHSQTGLQDVAEPVLAAVRRAGGLVAMDDVGTGYAGLSQLLELRPHFVKLDRELVTGIDADPVKVALVEAFGDLAGRMDTWILAEGIETMPELDTLISLGVPLGQGWVLGRPAEHMVETLPASLVDHIRTTALRASLDGHVAGLVRPARVGRDRNADDVLLGGQGQPSLVRSVTGDWVPALVVSPSTQIVDAARRAMARNASARFAPMVCTDGRGQVIGVVGVDQIMLWLSTSRNDSTRR